MGCSFSDGFVASPFQLYPGQSPLTSLSKYLQSNNPHFFQLYYFPIFLSYSSNEASVVDITVAILSLSEAHLTLSLRRSLLLFLRDLLIIPHDNHFHFRFFNQPIVQPDGTIKGRIDRLKILLLERNEETEEGELVLKQLAYFSLLFEKINIGLQLQYTIILDKSGSMGTKDPGHRANRWADAREAIEHMTEAVEALSPNGINFYLFSSKQPGNIHPRHVGIRECEHIKRIFSSTGPGGSTDLAGVLRQAFSDHFHLNGGRPEHILVITDGEPDCQEDVVRELVFGVNSLKSDTELGITFMQVGCCERAAAFLHKLQDCLTENGAKYNIIDCLTHHDYENRSLCDVIQKSVVRRHP